MFNKIPYNKRNSLSNRLFVCMLVIFTLNITCWVLVVMTDASAWLVAGGIASMVGVHGTWLGVLLLLPSKKPLDECLQCGYPTHSWTTNSCPECGLPL